MEKKIVYIKTEELFPHPDNPRKDLGDLTELSASIRQQGVLQNLTVVSGHKGTEEEMEKLRKLREKLEAENGDTKLGKDAIAELDEMIARGMVATGFTVVIGHRRCAAAKLAGLKELPCVVADMSPLEQVRTMAVENMQRADLKPYEEADSFQLMLDLGDTKESISERTGFSRSTIDKRLRLLKYDRVKLKSAMDRGGTLQDYLDLEKVEDEEKRTEVLNFIGTADFRNKLKEATDKQERDKRKAGILEAVKKFAKPFPKKENVYSPSWDKVGWYSVWKETGTAESVEAPKDADKTQYYYYETYSEVSIYRKKKKAEPVRRPREEIEFEKWHADLLERLKEIAARHRALRLDFVKSITESRLSRDYLYIKVAEAAALVYSECLPICVSGSMDAWKEITGLNTWYACDDKKKLWEGAEKIRKEPMRALLIETVSRLEGNGVRDFWVMGWKAGCRAVEAPRHDKENLMNLRTEYSLLEALGYEMSEEEKKAADGSLVKELLEDEPKLPGDAST